LTDGTPAQVLAENGAFKAVHLAAGSHRVVLTYQPWRYAVAFVIRIIGVFGGLLVFLLTRSAGSTCQRTPVESS
jgi:uncharacterized membrane protein YfhO